MNEVFVLFMKLEIWLFFNVVKGVNILYSVSVNVFFCFLKKDIFSR